jgi:hypothetical protein
MNVRCLHKHLLFSLLPVGNHNVSYHTEEDYLLGRLFPNPYNPYIKTSGQVGIGLTNEALSHIPGVSRRQRCKMRVVIGMQRLLVAFLLMQG